MNTMIEDFKDAEIERLKEELSKKQSNEMFDLKKMVSNMGRLLGDMSNQYRDVKYELHKKNEIIEELLKGVEPEYRRDVVVKDISKMLTLVHENEKLKRELAAKESELNGLYMIIESQVLSK